MDGQRFHDGVDLATFCGDRVTAAHDSIVLASSRHCDHVMGWVGNLRPYLRRLDSRQLWMTLPIVIDDGNGYRSLTSTSAGSSSSPGGRCGRGQRIGYEGWTGRASGRHLHYRLFSPWDDATMAIHPQHREADEEPKEEIARVDPLLVLPPKPGINAPATPRPSEPAPTTGTWTGP